MASLTSVASVARPPRRLRPAAVWSAAAAVVLAVTAEAWWPLGQAAATLFVSAVTLSLGALIVLATRRVLVATVLIGALLGILRAAAVIHLQLTDLTLHSYDVVGLFSWRVIAALWSSHPLYAAALVAALAATAALAVLAWRLDGMRIDRRRTLAALVMFGALAWLGAAVKAERSHTEYFTTDSYFAFFFSSWSETVEALWRGQIIEAAAQPSGPPFAIPLRCKTASKPPHIILIHEESVAQPSLFPTLSYDRSLDSFFHSHDGKLHKLRVETYGGGSWVTEFSVLTGLSARSAGGLRNFVPAVMAGKVRDTLPQALARCGYRNVAINPMLRIYLSMDRIFGADGISEIIDANDQHADWPNERDKFYFGSALAAFEAHLKVSQQPMFVFIETMATHSAYDFVYSPEVKVPGGGAGTPPELSEYLRRLAMAHMDYDALKTDLARRFPDERFLLVHFGDHQPMPTAPLLGFRDDATAEEVMRGGNNTAFLTYYAMDGVGFAPPPLPAVDALDVPYLGTAILEAAGLPLSDSFRERKRLMSVCRGRYHDCAARDEILGFHRRLIDSGLMDAL